MAYQIPKVLLFISWLITSIRAFIPSRSWSIRGVWPRPNDIRGIANKYLLSIETDAMQLQRQNMESEPKQKSLASSYVVHIASSPQKERWSLIRIAAVADDDLAALQSSTEGNPCSILTCSRNGNTLAAEVINNDVIDPSLISVLSRILVQRVASRREQQSDTEAWKISLPGEDEQLSMNNLLAEDSILQLYSPILDSQQVELVEMVTQAGEPLGMVPRPLVHSFNLLHRGIGMVVARKIPILKGGMTSFPDLYVHRRTDFKRIFPSLYDMFVGGVSAAKEDAKTTAAREVAEELGLSRALVCVDGSLSDPLFDCIVCTSYNRCVVTVFCYTFDDSKGDKVRWQEEEVAWGDFVPYAVIKEAARLSIQRMMASGTWPGSSSPYALEPKHGSATRDKATTLDWKTWDFVPDGLLVWEAWLQWQDGKLPSLQQ